MRAEGSDDVRVTSATCVPMAPPRPSRTPTFAHWLSLAAALTLALPWPAQAQSAPGPATEAASVTAVDSEPETDTGTPAETAAPAESTAPAESAAPAETVAEPEVGTWALPPPVPEDPPGPPRFRVLADVTYAQGLHAIDESHMRAGCLSLEARALVTPQFEVAFRWALGFAGYFGGAAASAPDDRFVRGNPSLALTYLRTLPAVDVRLGAELVVGVKRARGSAEDSHGEYDSRELLRSIDGLQAGWRFAAGATTAVLEASLESRRGPVRVGARAAYALFLGPVATVFVAGQLGMTELGLRVGGGVIDLEFKHDGKLGFKLGSGDGRAEGVAITHYVRLARGALFAEVRGTYAYVGHSVLSLGVGAGASF